MFRTLLLLFVPLVLHGQVDTSEIVRLNDRALEIAYSDPAEAMRLAEKALKMSRASGFSRGEVRALIRKGIVYDIRTENELAIDMYRQSLRIAEKTGDTKGAASNLNNLGLICYKMNRYTDALRYFTRAYSIFLELKDEENLGFVANNIGLLHMEMERYPQALSSYRQALGHYAKSSRRDASFDVYSNIGSTYESVRQLDSALVYTEKAVEGYRRLKDDYSLGITMSNLGTLYFALGNFKKAEKTLREAMLHAKAVGNIYSFTSSACSLASVYDEVSDSGNAYELLNQAYELLPEIQSSELGYKVCLNLARHEIARGNRSRSLQLLGEYERYHTAYYSETMKKNYAEMEQKFSLAEEQRKSREKIRDQYEKHFRETVFWASGLALLVLSGLLTFFVIRKRNLQKQLESQQAVFDATMEERRRISYDLHDHVGSQLSYVVNNLELIRHENENNERISRTFSMSQAAMGSLRDTVWALHTEELTISVLAQRLENAALKSIEQAPGISLAMETAVSNDSLISAQNTLHVMRIFQEAVQNVIRHANASEIAVQLAEDENHFVLSISDNGKGLQDASPKPFHYGLQSMRERASKIGATLTIGAAEYGTGTVVSLKWPKNSSIA